MSSIIELTSKLRSDDKTVGSSDWFLLLSFNFESEFHRLKEVRSLKAPPPHFIRWEKLVPAKSVELLKGLGRQLKFQMRLPLLREHELCHVIPAEWS